MKFARYLEVYHLEFPERVPSVTAHAMPVNAVDIDNATREVKIWCTTVNDRCHPKLPGAHWSAEKTGAPDQVGF